MSKRRRVFLWVAYLGYLALMLWLLFGQRFSGRIPMDTGEFVKENLNLCPLRTIVIFVRILQTSRLPVMIRYAYINLAGNVVMFVPLGFFLPAVHIGLRTFRRMMQRSAAIIIAAELTQLLTQLGACDVDDLILNLVGCAIGYIVFQIAKRSHY